MRSRLAVACALASITLLGFFVFPGHTYLHSDTQIYVPMLERIWDPTAYPGDLVAAKPHLAYTVYDEVALGLRRLFGVPFEAGLIAQQLLFRAAQIAGVYLLARALPLTQMGAVAVAGVAGLGATIVGPSVLLIEYEPVPRGFAIGLVFLGIGLASRGRWIAASIAGSLGFLYHAPTTVPFWLCFAPLAVWRGKWRALLPLGAAVLAILLAAHFQAGAVERQRFFFAIPPALEELQRMRASYNWVSVWAPGWMGQYALLWAASLLAYWRVRPQGGRAFALGLPLLGMLSVPVSYLLLEKLKWGLMPQIQPARVLLFVTAFALILGTAAGLRAVERRVWVEALAWFALVFAIPLQSGHLILAAALAATLVPLVRWPVPVLAAYFLIPTLGGVRNYPHLETPDLDGVAEFARSKTSKDAMFGFAGAGKALQPGIFRVRALRSVYVDWKAGGQVNYYPSLAYEWWERWRHPDASRLDYVVVNRADRLRDKLPVYENASYAVYRLK